MTNRPDRDASHLLGWICAGGLLLAFSVYLLWSGPGKAWLCSENDQACAREWLAALSGWAAVVAAAPTVYFLNKQIRDANRHHIETLMLQLQPTFALAKRVMEHAFRVQMLAQHIITIADSEPQTGELATMQMEQVLKPFERLQNRMDSRDFDDFEAGVGSEQPGALQSLREEIRSLKEYITDPVTGGERTQRFLDRRDRVAQCAKKSIDYSGRCADQAGAFLDRWIRASSRTH